MNGLSIALTTFSITAWVFFNFSFTSNLSGILLDSRKDLFIVIFILSITTNLICFIYFASLYRATVTDPGRIPDTPPWNLIQPEANITSEAKKSGAPRFCRYERKYKPDRAHHCSQCQQCTLRMDHHCPWLDNCVGFWNYKFFLLTLFYGVLGMMSMAVSCGWLAWYILNHTGVVGLDISRLAFGIMVSCVCGLGSIVIVMFLSMHIIMVAKGMTTLEVFEKTSAYGLEDDSCVKTICCTERDPVTKQPRYPPSQYKLDGIVRNFKAAIGEDVLFWLLPTVPVMKTGSRDGLSFETKRSTESVLTDPGPDSPLINPDQQ